MWIVVDTFVTIDILLRWMGDPLVSCWNWVPPSILGAVRVVPGGDCGVPRHVTMMEQAQALMPR